MKPNVFTYSSYRGYLKDRLECLGSRSGMKRRAAESLAVHTTFVSQVVLGKADLSLDQAERMNSFLAHSEEESEFFLDLLIYERAAEPTLKKRFEKKLKKRQGERAQIKKHLGGPREISEKDQARFYSSHIFGLLHVLSSIPKFQQRKQLAEAVGYSPALVSSAIEFLLNIGILKAVKDRLQPGDQHIHLGHDAKLVRQHHANWRLATLQHLGFSDPTDLHYSLTFSCSEEDAAKIRESLLSHLQSLSKTIQHSKEEAAFVYCFDFFRW